MDGSVLLHRARRRAGLTQRALANATGVAQPTIARIERGSEQPRLDTLTRLLAACGHRLALQPAGGQGLDRTAIRELLSVSPLQRVELLAAEGRALTEVPVGALLGPQVRPRP